MFRFAIKKAFYDLWDNLYFALAVNVTFTLVTLGLAALPGALPGIGILGIFLFVPLPFLAASLVGGLATFWAKDIVFDGMAKFGQIGAHFSASWRSSLVFAVTWLLLIAGLFFGVPFYSNLNEIAGFVFGVVMAWMLFFAAGMGLYYPGLRAQVEPNIGKLVKKSFLVFLANPWASLVLGLGVVLGSVLSVFTLGFFPGVLGVAIWLQVGFKFILAKYEWIEANPDADHKKVPWSEVLADDMDKIGPRTLKSLIFPWKD